MRSWVFVSTTCSGCLSFPCNCAAPRTVVCACGGSLLADDTLEAKGRSHTAHVPTDVHQAWRLGLRLERPTATQPGASETTGSVRVSALVGGRASAAAAGGRDFVDRRVGPCCDDSGDQTHPETIA